MVKIMLVAYLLGIALLNNASAEEFKDSFYAQVGRAVIRLEHISEVMTEGNAKPSSSNTPDGTGVFIWSEGRLFLMTARHVVATDHDVHARVKVYNEISKTSEMLILKLPRSNWIFHPDNGDSKTNAVDLAVIRLTLPNREGFSGIIKAFSYQPDNGELNQVPPEDALPPEQIITFGFPGDTGFELLEQRPMARLGIISMHTGEKFIKVGGNYANERCDILDIKAFPGNSGSPVISALGPTRLLGIVIASNSSDIGVMEPASRIRELLDLAKKTTIKEYDYWTTLN
jgi:hypothetical protein